MASEQANIVREDRISQLPDHILHNIIFYLQQIELEQYSGYHNSVLNFVLSSKACHQAWLFRPHQSFSSMSYYDYDSEKEKSFRDHLDQSLESMMNQGVVITSFGLRTKLSKPMHLTSWLQGLDVLKLKIIQLDFVDRNFKMSMDLLSYISTLEDQHGNQKTRLPSLLRLRMEDVDAKSNTIESIIRGYPSLNQFEILFLYFDPYDDDDNDYDVDDDDDDDHTLDIDAPRLRKFSYESRTTDTRCFSFASCSDLRELSLSGASCSKEKTLQQLLIQLTNLERLSITRTYMKRNSCISSLSVTELRLDYCTIGGVLRIDCPNLHELSYRSDSVPQLHYESTWDGKFYLHLKRSINLPENNNRFFEELGSFMSDTKINVTRLTVEIIYTGSLPETQELNMKVMTERFFVPWPQITKLKHLKLELWSYLYFPSEILHGLLLICHPDFITCTFFNVSSGKLKRLLPSIMNVAEKKGVRFECGCVDGNVSDECWHHSLSDVKLEWCGITQNWHPEVHFQSVGLDDLSQLAMAMYGSKCFNVRVSFKLLWQ